MLELRIGFEQECWNYSFLYNDVFSSVFKVVSNGTVIVNNELREIYNEAIIA
jgi:hypothetical protein